MAVDADLAHGQRSRLVAAENVHASEVLDRRELLDDHLLSRHPDRAPREGYRHHHGQELRGQPDRQRDREEKRLQDVPMQEGVDQEDEEYEEHDHLQDQEAESTRAALELG